MNCKLRIHAPHVEMLTATDLSGNDILKKVEEELTKCAPHGGINLYAPWTLLR